METVPYPVVALLCDDVEKIPDDQIVVVGRRHEVVIDRLDDVLGDGFTDDARRYWDRCLRFWKTGDGPVMVLERELLHVRQRDDQTSRVDLGGELKALMRLGRVGPVIRELTAASPDWPAVVEQVQALSGRVTRFNERSVLSFLHSSPWWEDCLGGGGFPGERNRRVTLNVIHAPWRDRRSRRLVTLSVHARELWPVP